MNAREQFARNKLEEFICGHNNEKGEGGQYMAAELLSISNSILSQLRRDIYKGNAAKMWEKIATYFEAKLEAAETYHNNGYVPIRTSEEIIAYIRYCHIKGGVMAITGDAGVGKTMAIRRYMDMYPDNVVLLTMRNGYRSIKTGLMVLAKALGIKEKGKNIYALCEEISERLKDNMLIIIDEAQHCSLRMIDNLRSFTDEFDGTKKTLGLVFIGNKTTADKFGGSQDSELGQISSRAISNMTYSVDDVSTEDISKLFDDITDTASVEFMHGITQGPQGIRGAVRVYEVARDNKNTSYDGLVAAAKHKGIALR